MAVHGAWGISKTWSELEHLIFEALRMSHRRLKKLKADVRKSVFMVGFGKLAKMILRGKRKSGVAQASCGNSIPNLVIQIAAFLFATYNTGEVEINLKRKYVCASEFRVFTEGDDALMIISSRYARSYFL